MNVSLTPKLEDFVKQKVDQGLYNSVSEVMRGEGKPLDMDKIKANARSMKEARA